MPSYVTKSIDAATGTGPGSALVFDSVRAFHQGSAQVVTTGNPTSVAITVEATLDGVAWATLIAPTSASFFGFSVPPILGIRAKLVTLDGGSSPTVAVFIGLAPTDSPTTIVTAAGGG
jgi:hypothetical protein